MLNLTCRSTSAEGCLQLMAQLSKIFYRTFKINRTVLG